MVRSPSSCPWAELVEVVCVLFLGLRPFFFFPFFSFIMLNVFCQRFCRKDKRRFIR